MPRFAEADRHGLVSRRLKRAVARLETLRDRTARGLEVAFEPLLLATVLALGLTLGVVRDGIGIAVAWASGFALTTVLLVVLPWIFCERQLRAAAAALRKCWLRSAGARVLSAIRVSLSKRVLKPASWLVWTVGEVLGSLSEGVSRVRELWPLVGALYLPSAIVCWAVGYVAGVPNGTNYSMLAGYGGGFVLSVVVVVAMVVAPSLSFRNIEVRRRFIERIGYERFLTLTRSVPVSKDDYGKLWRIALPRGEPIMLVEVINATAEADGTRKRYFLRVPPQIQTARAAVAWTFDSEPGQYSPRVET